MLRVLPFPLDNGNRSRNNPKQRNAAKVIFIPNQPVDLLDAMERKLVKDGDTI